MSSFKGFKLTTVHPKTSTMNIHVYILGFLVGVVINTLGPLASSRQAVQTPSTPASEREASPPQVATATEADLAPLIKQETKIRSAEDTLARCELALKTPSNPTTPPASPQAKPETKCQKEVDYSKIFDQEPRIHRRAAPMEYYIYNQIVNNLGIQDDRFDVECRTYCCELLFEPAKGDRYFKDYFEIGSDVGIGLDWQYSEFVHPEDSPDGRRHVYTCDGVNLLDRAQSRDLPNRAEERKQLLMRAQADLNACAQTLSVLLEVDMTLYIDTHGAIRNVFTRADPTGLPEAECMEQALLTAAEFAPADRDTSVPAIVVRGPETE